MQVYFYSFGQNEKKEKNREYEDALTISAGSVFHVANRQFHSGMKYKFNYGFHVEYAYFRISVFKISLNTGFYSKRYDKNITLSTSDFAYDFSNMSHPVVYLGFGIKSGNDIKVAENISMNLSTGIHLSGTFHPTPDASRILEDIEKEGTVVLYNYLWTICINGHYDLGNGWSAGLNVFFFKECFKNYHDKFFIPFSTRYRVNTYGYYEPTNLLALPEFPIFSISPQLSFKYQISN